MRVLRCRWTAAGGTVLDLRMPGLRVVAAGESDEVAGGVEPAAAVAAAAAVA